MTAEHTFKYVNHDGKESLLVLWNGATQMVPSNHLKFNDIRDGLFKATFDDTQALFDLINEQRNIPVKLQKLSDRIAIANGKLTFDGDEVDNSLTQHIVELAQNGDDALDAFVKFMENLYQNPSEASRSFLYEFVNSNGITIDSDGYLVVYKSVRDDFTSVTCGVEDVYVNDEKHVGHIPNPVGAVVTMARSVVDDNRNVACSVGLHVGAWQYVSTFGGTITLKVRVNPRDVVSVPNDHSNQKIRVCRYEVLEVITAPITSVYSGNSHADTMWDDDEEEETDDDEEYEYYTYDDEDDKWVW